MILHPDDFGRLAELRGRQLREEADRARLAHEALQRRRRRARRPRVTIEVNLPEGLAPEQVERIFANLVRSVGR